MLNIILNIVTQFRFTRCVTVRSIEGGKKGREGRREGERGREGILKLVENVWQFFLATTSKKNYVRTFDNNGNEKDKTGLKNVLRNLGPERCTKISRAAKMY